MMSPELALPPRSDAIVISDSDRGSSSTGSIRGSRPEGACIWLTGLSGAGKSTTAQCVARLLQAAGRYVSVLDGDVIRSFLSPGLGFSRVERDVNVRRIGYVAAEIVRHGGVVVCATISPYRAARAEVRAMFATNRFFEVFVDCPLEICESRDVKGLYAEARAGRIRNFTGIDDPYEPPEAPELRLSTVAATAEANAFLILDLLIARRLIDTPPDSILAAPK